MEHLLTVNQVAAILGIYHKKVQRLARTGVLPCIKVGSAYRFRESTLEAWVEDNEISERKPAKAQRKLGVPVQGRSGDDETENPQGLRIHDTRFREGGAPKLDFFSQFPKLNE